MKPHKGSFESNPTDDIPDGDSILKEILKAALDTSVLNEKTLAQKINIILDLRINNELMFNQLLRVGVEKDCINVQEGILINNKSKDSIVELTKLKRLLDDLSTENVKITMEEKEELDRLRKIIYDDGQIRKFLGTG